METLGSIRIAHQAVGGDEWRPNFRAKTMQWVLDCLKNMEAGNYGAYSSNHSIGLFKNELS
jgi:hypothetical protein